METKQILHSGRHRLKWSLSLCPCSRFFQSDGGGPFSRWHGKFRSLITSLLFCYYTVSSGVICWELRRQSCQVSSPGDASLVYLAPNLAGDRGHPCGWVSDNCISSFVYLFFFLNWLLCSEALSPPTPGSHLFSTWRNSSMSELSRGTCHPVAPLPYDLYHLYLRPPSQVCWA